MPGSFFELPQAASQSVDMVSNSVRLTQPKAQRMRFPFAATNKPPRGMNNPSEMNIPVGTLCARLCGAVVVTVRFQIFVPLDANMHVASEGAPEHATVTVGANPEGVGVAVIMTVPFEPRVTVSEFALGVMFRLTTVSLNADEVDPANVTLSPE